MGSSSTTSERRTQTVNPYIQSHFDPVWTQAQGLISTPFTPYGGSLTAPLSGLEQQAAGLAQAGLGAGAGAVNAGIQAAQAAGGYQPLQVQAPQAAAVSAGPAAQAGASGYQAATGEAVQAGPAQTAQAASVDRGAVRDVGGGLLDLNRIAELQNPYADQVLQGSLADLDRARRMTINEQAGDFTKAGAFGGSRQGVADSLTNQNFLQQAADLSAKLRSQGFDTAAQLAEGEATRGQAAQGQNQQADLSVAGQNAGFSQQAGLANIEAQNALAQFNAGLGQQGLLANLGAQNAAAQFTASAQNSAAGQNAQAINERSQFDAGLAQQAGLANAQNSLQAQQSNQSAGLQAANLDLTSAGLLGDLGGRQQQMGLADVNALAGLGATARGVDQAGLEALYQEFLRQQQYPMQQSAQLMGLLGALPATGTLSNSRGTSTTTQNPGAMQMIATALQAAAAMGGVPSDARLKTGVRPIGQDGRGRNWYAYRYVWDAPEIVRHGVMAQEILASDADAVGVRHGYLTVDYGALN